MLFILNVSLILFMLYANFMFDIMYIPHISRIYFKYFILIICHMRHISLIHVILYIIIILHTLFILFVIHIIHIIHMFLMLVSISLYIILFSTSHYSNMHFMYHMFFLVLQGFHHFFSKFLFIITILLF